MPITQPHSHEATAHKAIDREAPARTPRTMRAAITRRVVPIFGREPALWLALVAALVKITAAFGLDLTAGQQAGINAAAAAATGLIVAALVRDGIQAAVLGFAQAALALAVGFGLHWNAEQQAVVMGAVAVTVAMFTRTQVTAPIPAPVPALDTTGPNEIAD